MAPWGHPALQWRMPHTEPSAAGAAIQPLPTSVTGFVGAADAGPLETPVLVTSAAHYHATFGPGPGADRPLGHAVDLFFANGGVSALVVRAAGPAPGQLVPDQGPGGVHALEGSGVTVLVVPGLTAADTDQVGAALERCAAWRAVLVLDLPPGPWGASTEHALGELTAHAERAAAYHPWVSAGGVSVPPSGALAGVIARVDAGRGVWKAPAGVELLGVDGLTQTVTAQEGDILSQAGVNALRDFPGRGLQVWGARTLAAARTADPSLRYVNIRRFSDHVVRSVSAGLGFVADEPGDAALWARVRQLGEDFLQDLWRQGALQGTKPEHAYWVRCGLGETMAQADVVAGRLVLELGLAPVRPAEFDVLRLHLQALVPSAGPTTTRAGLLEVPSSETPEPPEALEPPETEQVRRVDLRRVVSRYIGETEKNLSRLLDQAARTGEVLLFDEADALFGRRTSVRDAHDRYANQEVTALVERMARERGVQVRWRRRTERRRPGRG